MTLEITPPKKGTDSSNVRYVINLIQAGKDKNPVFTPITVSTTFLAANGNKILIEGLNQNTSYKFTITAVNEAGDSSNGKSKPKDVFVNVTAKTAKYTAVKASKPMKYIDSGGSAMVESLLTLPKTIPAGASYVSYHLYLVTGSGKNAVYTAVTDFTVIGKTSLAIDWSQLGLSDTVSNKFVLRAVTNGIESLDTKITIKFSTLKAKA